MFTNNDVRQSARSSSSLRGVGTWGGLATAVMALAMGWATPTNAQTRTETSSAPVTSSHTITDCAASRNCVINRQVNPNGTGARSGTSLVWGREAAEPAAGTRQSTRLTVWRYVMSAFGWNERQADTNGNGLKEYQRERPEPAAVQKCDRDGCLFRITNSTTGEVEVIRLTRTATNMQFLERQYPSLAAAMAANPNADVFECIMDANGNIQVRTPGDPGNTVPVEGQTNTNVETYTPPGTSEIVTTTATDLPNRFGALGAIDLSLGGSRVKPFDGQLGYGEVQYRALDNVLGGQGTLGVRVIGGNPGGPNPWRLGEAAGTVRLDNLAGGAVDLRVDAGRLVAGNGASNIPNFDAIRINADNSGLYSGTGVRVSGTVRPSDAFSITGAAAFTNTFNEYSLNASARLGNRFTLNGDYIRTDRNQLQGDPNLSARTNVIGGSLMYDWDGQPGGFRVGPRVTYYNENVDIATLPTADQRTSGITPGLEAGTTFGDGRFGITGRVSYGSEPNRFRLPILGETRDRDKGFNVGVTFSMALGGSPSTSSVAPRFGLDRASPTSELRPQGNTQVFVNVVDPTTGAVTRRLAAGPVDPTAPMGAYDSARLQREGIIPADTNLIVNGQAADPLWAVKMAGNNDAYNQCRTTPTVTFNLPTGTVNCTQLNQAYIAGASAPENANSPRAQAIVAFQARLQEAQTRAANLQGTSRGLRLERR